MARGDIQIYSEGAFGYPGDETYLVQSGSAASIKAGEPVAKSRGTGGSKVTALATSKPLVGTDFLAGIAATDSTDTATANGVVRVTKLMPGITYLIAPKTATSWDTQAEYDALVGARVTFDLTSSVYTINATDSGSAAADNGLVVEPLDISKVPGKVRFSIRAGCAYFA